MIKTTEIKYQLEEEDIKQAIVEYMDRNFQEDFVLEEIQFKAESDGCPKFRCYIASIKAVVG
jgi:hypothetical protein